MKREKQFLIIACTLVALVLVNSVLMLAGNPKLVLLGILLIPLCVFGYCYPRLSLWIFILYLPFAGSITYAMPGVVQKVGTQVFYNTKLYGIFHLAKDIFYIPALLAILVQRQTLSAFWAKHRSVAIAVSLLFFTSLFTFFWVNLPQSSSFVGILGLKVLIGYIPLLLCAYYLLRYQEDLIWFNRLLTLTAVGACLLAFIQYYFLLTGICEGNVNLPPPIDAKATLQARCFVGGSLLYNPLHDHVWYLQRLPGTFVSPWQWAWFLISGSFITYLTTFSDPSRPWKILGAVGMIMVLAASLISGQWTAFLVVPLVFLLLIFFNLRKSQQRGLTLLLIGIVTVLGVSQWGRLSYLLRQFGDRWQYSSPVDFIIKQMQWVLHERLTLLGQGLGTASSAARRLQEISLIETFPPKILYEGGILGFLAFFGVVTIVTIQGFKAYRSLKSPPFKVIGVSLWLFTLFISYNPYYYPLAVDPVAVYYWLLAGVLLKLPEIEAKSSYSSLLPLDNSTKPVFGIRKFW